MTIQRYNCGHHETSDKLNEGFWNSPVGTVLITPNGARAAFLGWRVDQVGALQSLIQLLERCHESGIGKKPAYDLEASAARAPMRLVGSKQADTVFSYYAAFLNGYFWQSVVAAAKKPEAP